MESRSVLITGGFGFLGQAVAKSLIARGYNVVRADVAVAPAEEIAGVLDLPSVDLTDMDACVSVVNSVKAAFGGLSALINIAGGFEWETLQEGNVSTWQRLFTMNVLTTVTMTRAALPTIEEARPGRIVNVGAYSALVGDAGMGAYASSKSCVHRFTESLAAELAESHITVNAVLPGVIDTPANRANMPAADTSRWVNASAIADVVNFLVSDAARSISGVLLPVTRGGE
jgi:NAD(P)-dependent dehydrogenase (short-subunit alcohol dehydrogenase family)